MQQHRHADLREDRAGVECHLSPALDQLPAQFPSEAKDAMSNSIIATVEVLQRAVGQGLPQSVADAVKNSAFTAFLDASHVTTLVSAALALVAALILWFLLPHITPPQKGDRAVGAPPEATDPTDALVQDEQTRRLTEDG